MMKRYTFDQLAKRNCAECTTTITTTLPLELYFLASDVDALEVLRPHHRSHKEGGEMTQKEATQLQKDVDDLVAGDWIYYSRQNKATYKRICRLCKKYGGKE
jgi:hypothetical protein